MPRADCGGIPTPIQQSNYHHKNLLHITYWYTVHTMANFDSKLPHLTYIHNESVSDEPSTPHEMTTLVSLWNIRRAVRSAPSGWRARGDRGVEAMPIPPQPTVLHFAHEFQGCFPPPTSLTSSDRCGVRKLHQTTTAPSSPLLMLVGWLGWGNEWMHPGEKHS